MFEVVSLEDIRTETYNPWDGVDDRLDAASLIWPANEDDNDSAEE